MADENVLVYAVTMSMTPAEAGVPHAKTAGLAHFLHLAFVGTERVLLITNVISWGWVFYILFGLAMIATHISSESPVGCLLSLYLTIYSTLGFLWHARELHLSDLRGRAATDVEEGLTISTQNTSTSKPNEVHKEPSEAPMQAGNPSGTSAGSRHNLGFENADWMGKILWWASFLEIFLGAQMMYSCTDLPWAPKPSCNAGDWLAGLYFTLYGFMMLLTTSRQNEIERLSAADSAGHVASSGDTKKPAQVAPTATAPSTVSGYSTLGWVLNLGMHGHQNATALTKAIYWSQLITLISFVAICGAFWHLPGAQWIWTYDAVVGALIGMFGISLAMDVARSHGLTYY